MAADGADGAGVDPQGEERAAAGSGRRRRRRRRGSGATSSQAGTAASVAQPAATGGAAPQREQPTPRARAAKKGRPRGKSRTGARAQPKLPTTREVSAGGVVYRRTDGGGIEVVLASRRTRRGDLAWGLAKGGIEDGESREQAAIREVREETGLDARIEADLGDTKYMYVWEDVRIRKTVHFFLMRYTGGNVEDRDDEMEEIRWFPIERALKRAAYRGERDVLARALERLG
ncbi:MAG: NUDIX hydrolase [Planctomycetaceae bacterium]